MGITLVTDLELRPESTESWRALNLAKELDKCGYSAKVIGLKPKVKLGKEWMNTITVRPPKRQNGIRWMVYRHLYPLRVLIPSLRTESKFFILRGHYLGAILAPILKLFRRIVIYDFHGFAYIEEKFDLNRISRRILSPYTRLLELIALKLADKILVVSEGIRQTVPERYRSKALLLPNGVDLDGFAVKPGTFVSDDLFKKYHIPKAKKYLGFNGRYRDWFSIEDITTLAERLDDEYHIIVIGDGYEESTKERTNKISFLGLIPYQEVLFFLQFVYDVCLVPYREIWPRAFIKGFYSARKVKEYVAAGKPIVVADIVGKDDFLKENENCLTYKPGDPEDLARKIYKLFADRALYNSICRNNLLLAKKYTWENLLRDSKLIEYLKTQT